MEMAGYNNDDAQRACCELKNTSQQEPFLVCVFHFLCGFLWREGRGEWATFAAPLHGSVWLKIVVFLGAHSASLTLSQ